MPGIGLQFPAHDGADPRWHHGGNALAAASRCADGVLLPEGCDRPSCAPLPRGAPQLRIVPYAWLSLHERSPSAIAQLRPAVTDWREGGLYPAPLRTAQEATEGPDLDGDAFVREVAVCATAEECAHAIRALASAGADEVVLAVPAPDRDDQIARFADRVLAGVAGVTRTQRHSEKSAGFGLHAGR